jgi:DNA-3-methyladenine glycosylase II
MSLGTPEALRHLRRDAVLKRVIRQVGECTLKPARRQPYEALVRAIAHQQVHGRAAEAILGRFIALCPGPGFPAPDAVLALAPEAMRSAGLSANKVLAIRDIAEKAALGVIPNRAAARRLSDEALIERLVALRGVGRWTVEMLLIFTLGRADILHVDDIGER